VEVIGPRHRRRFAASAIVVSLIGAIVAAVLLTRSTSRSAEGSVARSASTSTAFPAPHPAAAAGTYPVYGMTPKQVERFTGKPTKIQGSCWLFRPAAGTQNGKSTRMVGTMSLGEPGSIASQSNGWVKLCFWEGGFSEAYRQIPIKGELLWRPWSPSGPILDGCADPSACIPP
jgi:hypothetical protein